MANKAKDKEKRGWKEWNKMLLSGMEARLSQLDAVKENTFSELLFEERERLRFLLSNGRPFKRQTLPKKHALQERTQCYSNSFCLALDCNLRYCEGYILVARGIDWHPVEHSWCATEADKVIDVTLRKPAAAYLGFSISPELMGGMSVLPGLDLLASGSFPPAAPESQIE